VMQFYQTLHLPLAITGWRFVMNSILLAALIIIIEGPLNFLID